VSTFALEKLPVRAVALCCDGVFQRYFAARVSQEMTLVGLVFQKDIQQSRKPVSRFKLLVRPVKLLKHLLGRWVIRTELRQSSDLYEPLLETINQTAIDCPVLIVGNVNENQTIELLKELQPDVVLVNGTKLIRSPLIDLAASLRLGMINLHTGLSPYSRGGNCNLHMLREGRPELVGVTVHHIDSGIDSGDLIFTARPELEPSDTFERIEAKVFLLGIELALRAVHLLQMGQAPRVKQWMGGKLFLKRTGYDYQPWYRFEVRRILKRGLIRDYLAARETRDSQVRTVSEEMCS